MSLLLSSSLLLGCTKAKKKKLPDPSPKAELALKQLVDDIVNSPDWDYYLPSTRDWILSDLLKTDSLGSHLRYFPAASFLDVNLCDTLGKTLKTHLEVCYQKECQEALLVLVSPGVNKKFEIRKLSKGFKTVIRVPESSDDLVFYATLDEIRERLFCKSEKAFEGIQIGLLNASDGPVCVSSASTDGFIVFPKMSLLATLAADSEDVKIAPVLDGLCAATMQCCVTFKTAYLADEDKDRFVYLSKFNSTAKTCPPCALKDRMGVVLDANETSSH